MKIHELLTAPERWTQGAYARTALGRPIAADDPAACQWCLVGAIAHCYLDNSIRYAVSNKIQYAIGQTVFGNSQPDSIVPWNDDRNRTHKQVLALVKKLNV